MLDGVGFNPFTAVDPNPDNLSKRTDVKQYLPAGNRRVSEKTLSQRVMEPFKKVPLRGLLEVSQENFIKKKAVISTEDISEDIVVATISNRHAGLLMGGYSKEASVADAPRHVGSVSGESGKRRKNTRWHPYPKKEWVRLSSGRLERRESTITTNKARHVLFWGGDPLTDERLIANIKSQAKTFTLTGVTRFTISTLLSQYLSLPVENILSCVMTERLISRFGNESPISAFIHLGDTTGFSADRILKSTYRPVPLSGLDVEAMKVKADTIKSTGLYNTVTNNCAWAALETIKAGLPEDALKKLPPDPYIITPRFVSDVIDFLVKNEYVQLGEVDENGVAWFDAREHV